MTTREEVLNLAQSSLWPNSEIVKEIEELQRAFGEQEGIEIARKAIAAGRRPCADGWFERQARLHRLGGVTADQAAAAFYKISAPLPSAEEFFRRRR